MPVSHQRCPGGGCLPLLQVSAIAAKGNSAGKRRQPRRFARKLTHGGQTLILVCDRPYADQDPQGSCCFRGRSACKRGRGGLGAAKRGPWPAPQTARVVMLCHCRDNCRDIVARQGVLSPSREEVERGGGKSFLVVALGKPQEEEASAEPDRRRERGLWLCGLATTRFLLLGWLSLWGGGNRGVARSRSSQSMRSRRRLTCNHAGATSAASILPEPHPPSGLTPSAAHPPPPPLATPLP